MTHDFRVRLPLCGNTLHSTHNPSGKLRMPARDLPRNRATYLASGRVSWHRFVPLYAVVLVVGVAMAWLIFASVFVELRFVLITPILLTAPAAAGHYLACYWGKCRNHLVAGLTGGFVGLMICLLRYHAEFCDATTWDFFFRLEMIPRSIYEVVNAKAAGVRPNGARPIDFLMWWGIFVIELIALIALCGGGGYLATARPFDEARANWCVEVPLELPHGTARALARAMERDDVDEFAQLIAQPRASAPEASDPEAPAQAPDPRSRFILHLPPGELEGGPVGPVYMTGSEDAVDATGPRGAVFVKWQLKRGEVARLAEVLPGVWEKRRPKPYELSRIFD
jgi:hypothetical protein